MPTDAARPLLEFRDVDFAYAVADRSRARPFALAALSFAIGPAEILGVIGPNSAGKTTLTRLATKVLPPSRGDVLLDGRPLRDIRSADVARTVAVVPQELPRPFPFSVGDLVLMGRYPHAPRRYFETAADRALAREAMAATEVLDLAGAPLESLSGGERQRAMFARALAQEPRLLILDEPTTHLDLRHQLECASLLRRCRRERGMSILLVSHDLNLAAELSDRLLLLADGRVARLGSTTDVLDESLLAAVYGCPVTVDKNPAGRLRVDVDWPAGG